MTTLTTTSHSGPIVLVGSENGITVIPTQTPLARLNYFDGKFLRAADLNAEQRYLRSLVELSNRAGGHGIAHGFEVAIRAQGELEIAPGMAIDPEGRVLLLPVGTRVTLAELIEKTRQGRTTRAGVKGSSSAVFGDCVTAAETPPSQTPGAGDLYLVTIAHAEALCGEEDVYGKVCQEACITSTDRPYRLEGIVVRARPLILSVPLPTSGIGLTLTHWRSRVATAYYEDERRRVASLISKAGLEADAWCHGAVPESGTEVPIAVVGRVGTGIQFLDLWTVRRERIDTPARRYWQWRMAMRPWDVFLAHILQFQCQLHSALGQAPPTQNPDDPCLGAQALVAEASLHFQTLQTFYAETTSRLMKMSKNIPARTLAETTLSKASVPRMEDLALRLAKATEAFKALPTNRLLINGGIIELPSAGYLPVVPGNTLTVNEQVRRLLGEGVDLRFCMVRPDYVAHALEEAQHLDRISLVTGIDNPNQKQEVDILVPYGQVAPDRVEQGRFYEMRLNVNLDNLLILTVAYQALSVSLRKAASSVEVGTAPDTHTRAGAIAESQMALIRKYLSLLEKEAKNPFVLEYLTGAARAETSVDGALAFHYAGSTGAFAAPTGSAIGKDTKEVNPQAGAVSDTSGAFRFFSARTAPALETAAAAETDRASAEQARNRELRSSISMTLELGGDPTELSAGRSVLARAECYLLLSAEKKGSARDPGGAGEGLLHLAFVGELDVEDVDVRVGKSEVREAKATLSGQVSFSILEADGEREAGSVHLTEGVTILRTEEAYGPIYKIEATEPSILQPLISLLSVQRTWESTTQAEVVGGIAFRSLKGRDAATGAGFGIKDDNFRHVANAAIAYQKAISEAFTHGKLIKRQSFRAWQTLRPEVVDPIHPAHEAAIRAVRSIGTALGSSRYADLAARRLFPAPTARVSSLNILATLDWVLFHRRRDKQCRIEKPMPQVQTRKYALYQVALTGDLKVADLARSMTKGGAELERWRPNLVQVIEFGAGIHAVVSSHTQVRASWRQDVGPDAGVIEGGIIASRGLAVAEGPRLAEDRLEALVEVVAPITSPVLQPAYVVQTRVPDGYDVPGNDGLIIIATRASIATQCHRVVGIESMAFLDQVRSAATTGRLDELTKLQRDLESVEFLGTTAVAGDLEALRERWRRLDFGDAVHALVVNAPGDRRSSDYATQGRAILTALGGTGGEDQVPTPAPLAPCPVITFVFGAVTRRNALLLYTPWDNGEHFLDPASTTPSGTMEFLNNVPQGDALLNFIQSLGPITRSPIRGVTVATPGGAPDSGAPSRLNAVLQALATAGHPAPASHRRVAETLSAHDREQLLRANFVPDNFDDIIFLEINDG